MKWTHAVAALAAVLVLASCGESPKQKLKRGVLFVKVQLEAVNKNPLASASYSSILEQGGQAIHYITACMGPQTDIPPVSMGGEPKPWSIVLREGPGGNEYTIDGYGEDLAKPLVSETVAVTPMPVE